MTMRKEEKREKEEREIERERARDIGRMNRIGEKIERIREEKKMKVGAVKIKIQKKRER